MFLFNLCPPDGPWPMPPWCGHKSFEPKFFETEYDAGILNKIISVNMADTWGRNYNFMMFENTKDNIEQSFDRASKFAVEVYVHDFHRAVYENSEENFQSLNYEIVDEIFSNDMRDESMTFEDMQKLVTIAHQKGLKIGLKHNIAFVDIGKYIGSKDIQKEVDEDHKNFNSLHSEEWINDYFDKWEKRLVEKAILAQETGFDIFSIYPNWMQPTFTGNEELANQRKKQLIKKVKEVFNGKISTTVDRYGFLHGNNGEEDWTKYDFYKDVDIIEFPFYNLFEEYKANDLSKEEIKQSFEIFFNDLETKANEKNINLTLMTTLFSYDDAINKGIIEYHDILNKDLKTVKSNYKHQENMLQALFEAAQDEKYIERVNINGYWWDDAMDPKVKVRISLAPSIRNKPAEAVAIKWAEKSAKEKLKN